MPSPMVNNFISFFVLVPTIYRIFGELREWIKTLHGMGVLDFILLFCNRQINNLFNKLNVLTF